MSSRVLRMASRLAHSLLAPTAHLTARKQWMADHLHTAGKFKLDAGATNKVAHEGKSLLPIGVSEVEGEFGRGAVITLCDDSGRAIARGLSNYSSVEARRIIRHQSAEIADILGYAGDAELIHRDNLVLL